MHKFKPFFPCRFHDSKSQRQHTPIFICKKTRHFRHNVAQISFVFNFVNIIQYSLKELPSNPIVLNMAV